MSSNIQWGNTTSESALDETKIPYSMRKLNIREWSWWDENSIFIEPHQTQKQAVIRDLRSFVFSSSGFGMFFLWNEKVRENCVRLKTTFICKCCFETNMDIYPFIAKACYWCNHRYLGDKIQSPGNEKNKWNNWSWKTDVHEAMKYCYKICLLDYPTPLP